MKKCLAGLLVSLILLSALCACRRPRARTVTSYDYFDTVTTVIGYDTKQADFDQISAEIPSR